MESANTDQKIGSLSRDEMVAIISAFYNFLTTHPFLQTSNIKTPPALGWPPSIIDTWHKMEKSEAVIDLLTHLPYIDAKDWFWYHDTKPIDYTGHLTLRRLSD